jgi:single-stranded-DNA-specific exonuclease
MQWNIKKIGSLKLAQYMNRLNVSSTMAHVFANRMDIKTAEAIVNTPETLFEDPAQITGAEEVACSIVSLLGQHKKFYVFADYDVDGMTSGYVMTTFLRSLGEDIESYFPERSEGYGLNMDFCRRVVKESDGNGVVITVDNGIAALKEVQYLKDCRMNIFVTDHHEPQSELPNCVFCDPWVGNPIIGGHLCGAGVAWKVCCIIEDILEGEKKLPEGYQDVTKYLPYVAIGTIADVMPSTPENILLINKGFEIINDRKVNTISTLLDYLGIDKINSKVVGWSIGPMMNACGRMGEINTAAKFFFMENESKDDIKEQCKEMDDVNYQRTSLQKKLVAQAEEELSSCTDKIILFDATGTPSGLSGVIAGKLCEKYGRPAFVYVKKEDLMICSARSINGIDLLPYLQEEIKNGVIFQAGGHAQACGVKFYNDPEKLEQFKQYMNEKLVGVKPVEGCINIDAEITFSNLSKDLLEEIDLLPYDRNQCTTPMFYMRDVEVEAKTPYKNKDHLMLRAKDKNGKRLNLVGWNMYPAYEEIGCPKKMDIAGTIKTVSFYDKTANRRKGDVTLDIEDMRPCS